MNSIPDRLRSIAAADRVEVGELTDSATSTFLHCGLAAGDAKIAAKVATYAQLHGSESHGLIHLPVYVIGLLDGTIKSTPRFATAGAMSCCRVMDADNGLGLVAGRKAIDIAIELARAYGVGAVAVRNSSHFGAAGYYSDRAAANGMIGLSSSNAMPAMAPPGGTAAKLGTNPIAAAFPVPGSDSIVVDMATTVVARGRVRQAKAMGQTIPLDWALDPQGAPTTDPDLALEGTLQPMGGPKGFGLGLVAELLCSALSDGSPGFDVTYEHLVKRPSRVSHFFLVLNPDGFAGSAAYGSRAKHIVNGILSTPARDEGCRPRLPGARGHAFYRKVNNEGIPMTGALRDALREAASLIENCGRIGPSA